MFLQHAIAPTLHSPPLRYVHASEIKTFGSVPARQKMLSTGQIGRTWAANYTTTSRLPLHPPLGPPNTDYDPSSLTASSLLLLLSSP